jgi:U4/U6.U5 tri-snRNP-associated protein 1
VELEKSATNAGNGDYYTPEEMAAMRKPKKKKERKLKKKALTADELTALEEAAAAAAGGGDGDLGSRADRERRAAERNAAVVIADHERRARFDAALTKANYASLVLRNGDGDDNGGGDEEEEEDEDLYRSLQKARELAAKKTQQHQDQEGDGNRFIQRRETTLAVNNGGAVLPSLAGGLTFTDIGEFTRGITVKEESGSVPVKIAPDALERENDIDATAVAATTEIMKKERMNDDEMTKIEEEVDIHAPIPMEEDVKPPIAASGADGAWGNWMPAAEAEAAAVDVDVEERKAKRSYRRNRAIDEDNATNRPKNTEASEAAVGSEKTIGAGLAGALAFLKDRGELKAPVEWAGRTNDHRDAYFTKAMGNLEDVYSGGRTEDRLALDVEVALTKKDEFGRILTPKEAFRQLCHDFHGIKPSRNSKEKRAKQVAKELAQRKAATGGAGRTLEGLKAVQEAAATPYMVLSGTVRPGQSRDATSGYATVDKRGGDASIMGGGASGSMNAVPRLGGQQGPPLTGKAKVEAMLGMAPPPPRPRQQHQQSKK